MTRTRSARSPSPSSTRRAWPFGLPFWPLWRALGVVVGWNVFVLLGLVAAGLLTYAWLRELGLGVGAALVGGLAFEVAPYRLEQTAAGHLLAPISALLPLSLWTFERARRGSRWWLLPSALAIASIPASGQVHLSLGAVPFYLAYVLVRTRAPWPVVGAVVGVALAAAAGVLVWLFTIEDSIGEGGRSLRQVGRFSADWLDFVVRHDRHGSESFVFLGLADAARGDRRARHSRPAPLVRARGPLRRGDARAGRPRARHDDTDLRGGALRRSGRCAIRASRSASCRSPVSRSPRSWPTPSTSS